MAASSNLVPGFTSARVVDSFEELIATPFADGINALCWPRTLEGDFAEVLSHLPAGEGITPVDEDFLRELTPGFSPAGQAAAEAMLADLERLRACGLAPNLDCIRAYPREEEPGAVPIDVYSFHADSATVETDTWLCTYAGTPSDGVSNDQAIRRVDVPETRDALLAEFGGGEGPDFEEFLSENCYDLHYALLPGASPHSFGSGNLWRIATAWPGCPVLPCIHRAPENLPGQPPRLLLIS